MRQGGIDFGLDLFQFVLYLKIDNFKAEFENLD